MSHCGLCCQGYTGPAGAGGRQPGGQPGVQPGIILVVIQVISLVLSLVCSLTATSRSHGLLSGCGAGTRV